MKLYGHPLSSCTNKVLITLAEKAHEAQFVTIDLFGGEHKRPEHLARHPFGLVPVLDDDGFVLFESRAIVRYLDARLPGPRLTPATTREAGRMEQWISVEQSYVAPHMQALVRQLVVAPFQGQTPDQAAIAASREALLASLRIVDQALSNGPFLVGDTFTLADVVLMPYVGAFPKYAAEMLGKLPHLAAWWERVSARPSWRAASATSAAA